MSSVLSQHLRAHTMDPCTRCHSHTLFSTKPTSQGTDNCPCHLGSVQPGTELPTAPSKVSSRCCLKLQGFGTSLSQTALCSGPEVFSCSFCCSKAGPREGLGQGKGTHGPMLCSPPSLTFEFNLCMGNCCHKNQKLEQ